MHWETKSSCGTLYFDICFIALVWNLTHNISKVCLYGFFLPAQNPVSFNPLNMYYL